MTNFEKIKAADFEELEKIIDKIDRFDLADAVCGEKCPYKELCDINDEEAGCMLEKSYTWYWLQMEADGGRGMIKDSGQRTEFSTGAVRDYHPEEKGRMDLLPWNAIGDVSVHCARGAAKYSEHNVDLGIPAHSLVDSGLRHIRKFICGETDEDHLVAAVWNFLWLLEMRTTHPELMDIPWRPKDEQEKE